MGRTIAQIQQSIVDAKNADPVLSAALTSTSKVAIWLLWTWVIATDMWVTEDLFDKHKAEVADIIATQKPHTLKWYVSMAKKYQKGDSLVTDQDYYAIIDEAKQIVAYAAAVELIGGLRIKVAKQSGAVLAKLGADLAAFTAYMGRIKDAGVRLQITSDDPDDIQLALNIFYDPLILDNTGARLDGTSATPVKDAVTAFLDNLPFNGLFVFNRFVDAVQAVDGVIICEPVTVQARYGVLPFTAIPVEYTPDAGYLLNDEVYFDANITYTAHGLI